MDLKECKLYFPSNEVAEPLDANQLLEAITEGETAVGFDLFGPDDVTVTDRIIYGHFLSFHNERGSTEAIAVIVFDRETMPPGLKGGEHTVIIEGGICEIPESMIDEDAV